MPSLREEVEVVEEFPDIDDLLAQPSLIRPISSHGILSRSGTSLSRPGTRSVAFIPTIMIHASRPNTPVTAAPIAPLKTPKDPITIDKLWKNPKGGVNGKERRRLAREAIAHPAPPETLEEKCARLEAENLHKDLILEKMSKGCRIALTDCQIKDSENQKFADADKQAKNKTKRSGKRFNTNKAWWMNDETLVKMDKAAKARVQAKLDQKEYKKWLAKSKKECIKWCKRFNTWDFEDWFPFWAIPSSQYSIGTTRHRTIPIPWGLPATSHCYIHGNYVPGSSFIPDFREYELRLAIQPLQLRGTDILEVLSPI